MKIAEQEKKVNKQSSVLGKYSKLRMELFWWFIRCQKMYIIHYARTLYEEKRVRLKVAIKMRSFIRKCLHPIASNKSPIFFSCTNEQKNLNCIHFEIICFLLSIPYNLIFPPNAVLFVFGLIFSFDLTEIKAKLLIFAYYINFNSILLSIWC